MNQKDTIYGHIWEQVGVNSLPAYGDYDESSMFGYATGMVIESYYRCFKLTPEQKIIAHFNEWMTTFGAFYIKEHLPSVATIFTTHATSIGVITSYSIHYTKLYEKMIQSIFSCRQVLAYLWVVFSC